MKSFALLVALLLHATGLWNQTDQTARQHLINQSLGQSLTGSIIELKSSEKLLSIPVRQRVMPVDIGAKNVLAVDVDTMLTLYSKNPGEKVPIASITKIVTILTILERHSLDEIVTIKKLPDYTPDDDTMGLVEGDSLTVRQLVQAALIKSANDSADALALWDAGSIPKFTSRMNAALARWGVTDSHFTSASGLTETNNYATASDLARIGKLILTNPFLRDTVKTTSLTVTSSQNHQFELKTTNTLLENSLLYGIKTGYTFASGECLLGITTIDGHSVITVILGSNDRFGDTVRLINWIESSYQWL